MATKHTCIIVDDEFVCRKTIENLVKNFDRLELYGSYESTEKALKSIGKNTIEIAFLDIMIPGENGLDLAKELRKTGTEIIFTTSNTELAIQAYNLDATDYLTKPVEFDRFKRSVERASEILIRQEDAKDKHNIAGINYDEIMFIEKDRDYLRIFHTDGMIRIKKSLRKLIAELESDKIVRIHKSFAVNKERITKIDRDHVFIQDKKLPLSRNGRNNLVEDLKVL